MKAMVLCAGLGTRLRPFTERWPKPAMPLLGQPIFRYAAALLKRAGVTELGINTHHLPEVMRTTAEVECKQAGLLFAHVHEPVIQGTGGGIRGLRTFLEAGDDFIVFNGDILFAIDLAEVVRAHREAKALATMVLLPMPPGEKYNPVEMDSNRTVRRIAGKGPGGEKLTPWHFSGVHVMSREIFQFMAAEGPEDINHDVYPRAIAAGRTISGFVAKGYWSDLGTPTRFLATQRDLLFGQVPVEHFGDANPFQTAKKGDGNWWTTGDHSGLRVAGPAYFENGAMIDPKAQIGSAVYVGPNTKVPEGARLNRVCVLPETELRANEELVEVMAWKDHRIPAPL